MERDDDAGGGGGRGGDGGGDEGGVFHRFDLRSTLKLRRPNVACFSKTLFGKKKKEEEKEEDFFFHFQGKRYRKVYDEVDLLNHSERGGETFDNTLHGDDLDYFLNSKEGATIYWKSQYEYPSIYRYDRRIRDYRENCQ